MTNKDGNKVCFWIIFCAFLFGLVFLEMPYAQESVPLYSMFEISVSNTTPYVNPFADVELNGVFTSPTGRVINFFGFHDGDGNGGQSGTVWKQRFMPDEIGVWTYVLTFTDGSPGKSGSFECTAAGAKPGPWRQDPNNPYWFKTAQGEHFLPKAMHANAVYTPIDWQDAINWVKVKGFNTIITRSMNTKNWGDGWPNITPFVATDTSNKVVDYDRFNVSAWREWDDMLRIAGEAGIYIGPFDGPAGDYGGQSGLGTVVPPNGLEYNPRMNERFDTARNLRVIRYLVARQAAFWNLAYWNLYSTEIMEIKSKSEVIAYGEYVASVTPFGRMITCQDVEQGGLSWLSEMNFPTSRKFNTTQAGTPSDSDWQNARPNNELSLSTYHGFPVLATESLWEGQARANKPLRMIWGSFAAGTHTMWADWRYDDGIDGGRWGSIGRGWTPIKPLTEHLFQTDQLGVDTQGDEQLVIATASMQLLHYWRMSPHNELVAGSTEAYCLAEPGSQYMIYAPNGGIVRLDLTSITENLVAHWLNPYTGVLSGPNQVGGGTVRTLNAPNSEDWVLFVNKNGFSPPESPTGLRVIDIQ